MTHKISIMFIDRNTVFCMMIQCHVFSFCFLCVLLTHQVFKLLGTEIRLRFHFNFQVLKNILASYPTPHLIQNKNDVIQSNKDKKVQQVSESSIFILGNIILQYFFPVFGALSKCIDGLLSNPNLSEDKNKYYPLCVLLRIIGFCQHLLV